MDDETKKIFIEQREKLPKEVLSFISSTNWDTDVKEIGSLYNLSQEELADFKREIILVLVGIVHPDEFTKALEQEVGIKGAVLEAIVAAVEQKIFAPIRPALIEFFDSEERSEEGKEGNPEIQQHRGPTLNTDSKGRTSGADSVPVVPNVPPAPHVSLDVAPDNLPTGEEESFLPNLAPKTSTETEGVTHPFEEKMKKVFTAGQQSMGDLSIEPAPQASAEQAPKAPPVYRADPYREAIE